MRLPAMSLLAASLLAAPALAQGVMAPGTMPPPPSASEPRPKAEPTTTRKPRAQRRAKEDGSDVTVRPGTATSSSGSYRDRIDTRPGSGAMELEDDPRAARPIMQNGRPGMGMRF